MKLWHFGEVFGFVEFPRKSFVLMSDDLHLQGEGDMRVELRSISEVTRMLELCGIKQVKMVVMRHGGSFPVSESVVGLEDLTEDLLRGFCIGDDFVLPMFEKVLFNPFMRNPVVVVPCYPAQATEIAPHEDSSVALHQEMASASHSPNQQYAGHIRYEHPEDHMNQYEYSLHPTKAQKKGTSCHQCKNTKDLQYLSFCMNTFEKRTKNEKRNCRKKFCQVCLKKFYNEELSEALRNPCWSCPSCRGECVCAACSRLREKGFLPPSMLATCRPAITPVDGRAANQQTSGESIVFKKERSNSISSTTGSSEDGSHVIQPASVRLLGSPGRPSAFSSTRNPSLSPFKPNISNETNAGSPERHYNFETSTVIGTAPINPSSSQF